MKILAVIALALSLLGNFIAAYVWLDRTEADHDIPPAPSASAGGTTADRSLGPTDPNGKAIPFAWVEVPAGANMASYAARLRAAGFPLAVIKAVVRQMIDEQLAAKNPAAGVPFWAQEGTMEDRKLRNSFSRERQALMESALGADGRPAEQLEPITREKRYGNLSSDKISSLIRLNQDYDEIFVLLYEGNTRGGSLDDAGRSVQDQEMIEREKRADLEKILTPAELEQYEMRTSRSASRVMFNLRQIEVNEQEYSSLYRLQKAFDESYPNSMQFTMEGRRSMNTARNQLHDQVRSVLDEQRFYSYLTTADPNFNQARKLTAAYPSITPAATYEFSKLQSQLQAEFSTLAQNQSVPPKEKSEQMRSMTAAYEARITALLGATATEAYKKTSQGRILNSPAGRAAASEP